MEVARALRGRARILKDVGGSSGRISSVVGPDSPQWRAIRGRMAIYDPRSTVPRTVSTTIDHAPLRSLDRPLAGYLLSFVFFEERGRSPR